MLKGECLRDHGHPPMERPETRYVAVEGMDVAYQSMGEGATDLLFCYGLGSNIDLWWEFTDDFLTRLTSFSRVIFFDRRGAGVSDRRTDQALWTWEDWTEDIGAVLDEVGSERTILVGALDAGPTAMLYCAMHPERVSSLVLVNTAARYLADGDYPIGVSESSLAALVETIAQTWGTTQFARVVNPSMADDEGYLQHLARTHRSSASPLAAAAQYDYLLRQDVRQVLPLIHVPTLVIHHSDSPLVPITHGRYLADRIQGATLVEIPGGDTPVISQQIADEIAEFVTGERPTVEPDRVLTTVMFTDIVSSTEHAASLGDNRWRSLLDAHDKLVRGQLRLFGGKEIKTTGDGFLLSFDGPARAIRCASTLTLASESIGIQIRVGLHTGECHVRDNDLSGLAVHIAARVGSLAAPGEVLVSGTVRDLVLGSGFEFTTRGEHSLKGVPGRWQLYALTTTTSARGFPNSEPTNSA